MGYTDINAETINRWIENGWEWGKPISHEIFQMAVNGSWNVLLTPTKPTPHDWFAPFIRDNRLDNVKILGLASGGGQQMPIFAALGAECTVLDYSQKQLESEEFVAKREGYIINAVRADMTKTLPFPDESFDIIFHPVSNCYVEDVLHIWRECFRVLKNGGILLAGMDNGFNFMVDDPTVRPMVISNRLPFNPLKNPALMEKLSRNDDGIQFSHTADEQLEGQLKAGLFIRSIYEDFDNDPDAIADGIPAYWATRSSKPMYQKDGIIAIRADNME